AVAAGWDYSLAIQYFTPCVDITNVDTRVNYDTTFCTIGGTNSPLMDATNRVVGTMWWSNSINSSNGTFAAAQYWMIENITLDIGTNIISVLGTNAFGLIGSDSVTIIRDLPEGASAVMAALALASMAVRKRQRHLITVSRR
ncbi:MAG: hypothetical protein NTV22_01375, partial [bacterium]|nr:hypothetical protein [bacterium]